MSVIVEKAVPRARNVDTNTRLAEMLLASCRTCLVFEAGSQYAVDFTLFFGGRGTRGRTYDLVLARQVLLPDELNP